MHKPMKCTAVSDKTERDAVSVQRWMYAAQKITSTRTLLLHSDE